MKALVISGATHKKCSDSYVRAKLLITHSLSNPLRIRLADESMSMARYGVRLQFQIDTLKISKEFIVTRVSGQHQIILGYEFLKEFNPHVDWTACILRISDNETIQGIITKRMADVNHLSGKQMSRLYKKEITRKSKPNIKSLYNERDDLRTYIGTLKQVSTMPNNNESLNAVQGCKNCEDVLSKISIIETDFGTQYTKNLHDDVLTQHGSALKPLLGFPVQGPDFDIHIDFYGPIPHSRVYRTGGACGQHKSHG